MQRTRIKVCGITRSVDALAAEAAGCDAIGFVFWPPSPRFVTIDQAAEIVACLSPVITPVGVFVDATVAEVADASDCLGLRAAQLCGELPAGEWNTLSKMIHLIRVVGVDSQPPGERDIMEGISDYLFDTSAPQTPGGSGRVFNWTILERTEFFPRVWLAGGLDSSNVGDAVRTVWPFAVDVSSGVEESPGIKSAEKIEAFVRAVREADESTRH
jgi:phosphoribosylanthranilate isomerase